ncbi:hypothetical protein HPC49_00610 [Pyxidicoccus fallax]|uniref:Uncharacterized protein n=1 Tax=Pyxidicoccus fallax TaxID=394095 RepID=A0A848L4J2_9BACT|nr:hypothetical protein [Pyxidicoccus fallax]NMO13536.1 hypothetical protein [Pyxidicoccus fallax]NPC76756.1 hypothetical protein [Pyxidicoccus fallax]
MRSRMHGMSGCRNLNPSSMRSCRARTVEGTSWDRGFVPMARRLVEKEKSLLALDLSYAQGKRWGAS